MLFSVAIITDTISSNSLLTFPGYFCLTLFTIKCYENKLSAISIVVIFFVAMLLIKFYTIYLLFVESLWSLPIILIHCLGIISAFFYLKLKRPVNMLPFALSFLLTMFMFFQGWDYWIHKINFGTFTGRVSAYNLPAKFEAFDEQKNLITENNFNDKLILLDFWFTRCGVCFQKFPQVQAVYDKYKSDSSIAIFAVDKPIEGDKPNQAFEVIKEEGYSFPVVIAKDEELPERFGVKGYPTTFVIDSNGVIVFKGDIAGAVKMVDELKNVK